VYVMVPPVTEIMEKFTQEEVRQRRGSGTQESVGGVVPFSRERVAGETQSGGRPQTEQVAALPSPSHGFHFLSTRIASAITLHNLVYTSLVRLILDHIVLVDFGNNVNLKVAFSFLFINMLLQFHSVALSLVNWFGLVPALSASLVP